MRKPNEYMVQFKVKSGTLVTTTYENILAMYIAYGEDFNIVIKYMGVIYTVSEEDYNRVMDGWYSFYAIRE